MLGPDLDLPVMRSERFDMPLARIRRSRCRVRQGCVEVIFRDLEIRQRRPPQPARSRRRIDGGREVAGKIARLRPPDPIPALGTRKIRVAGETMLDATFVKVRIVEGAELRR